jgi:hypothetical protein
MGGSASDVGIVWKWFGNINLRDLSLYCDCLGRMLMGHFVTWLHARLEVASLVISASVIPYVLID